MTIQRMENVGIMVDDLAATTSFFVELVFRHARRTARDGPVRVDFPADLPRHVGGSSAGRT